MQVKITIHQTTKEQTIALEFAANINKHNRSNAIGTICNEVSEGLRLLKACGSKSSIKSNYPVSVCLQIADKAIDTRNIVGCKQVELLRKLRADLKITVGNASSELKFFQNLIRIFNFMGKDILEMELPEFFAKLGEEKQVQAIARTQVKAELN